MATFVLIYRLQQLGEDKTCDLITNTFLLIPIFTEGETSRLVTNNSYTESISPVVLIVNSIVAHYVVCYITILVYCHHGNDTHLQWALILQVSTQILCAYRFYRQVNNTETID